MEYWVTAGDNSSYEFAEEFYDYWKKLNTDELTLVPHYLTWYKPGASSSFRTGDCIAQGRYCADGIGNLFFEF